MIERPILFSGPLVRAILDGRKTITRRLVTPEHAPVAVEPYGTPRVTMRHDDGTLLDKWYRFTPDTSALIEHMRPAQSRSPWSTEVRRPTKAALRRTMVWQANHCRDGHRWSRDEVAGLCPFGIPGDRLWVRETWAGPMFDVDPRTGVPSDIGLLRQRPDGTTARIAYAATDHFEWVDGDGFATYRPDGSPASHWKPSIHMPRWASRLTLEVVSVRVERLQDITRADARAEGVDTLDEYEEYIEHAGAIGVGTGDAEIKVFGALWDRIYGRPNTCWDANPWVWRVEFRRVGGAA